MGVTYSTASIIGMNSAARSDSEARGFRNILVDLDSVAKSQPALEMASVLARRSGAGMRMVDTRRAAAGRVMEAPQDVLLRGVGQFGHDLVVRSRELDWVAGSAGREKTTQHLFRCCPCPVWAVGVRPRLRHPAILAVVNVLTHDPITEELNASAIRFARHIGGLLEGDITVLHAWRQPAEERLHGQLPREHLDALLYQTAQGAEDALCRMVDGAGGALRSCRIELKRGAPERVIPRFVVDEGIDIVVTGARGERGIWPFVFGSTAERLLEETTCSVVAVKHGSGVHTMKT